MPGPTRGKARRVVHAPSHVRPQAQLEVWGVPARVKLQYAHTTGPTLIVPPRIRHHAKRAELQGSRQRLGARLGEDSTRVGE